MSYPVQSLAESVARVRQRESDLIDAARAWALREQRWLPPDVVALIVLGWPLALRLAEADGTVVSPPTEVVPATFWTRTVVNALLLPVIPDWCHANSTVCPHDLPEVMWRYIDFLVETGRLHPASDPLPELRRPLRCLGQLGDDGRWDDRLSTDPGPCICFVRHRGPTHGDGFDDAPAEP